MFGTLTHGQREPLTFIETRDLASALSRSGRDKPRISCELCRARKVRPKLKGKGLACESRLMIQQVRCSGEATGCDRCVSIQAPCKYPPREPRRKTSKKTEDQSNAKNRGSQQQQQQQQQKGNHQQQDQNQQQHQHQQSNLNNSASEYASSSDRRSERSPSEPVTQAQIQAQGQAHEMDCANGFDGGSFLGTPWMDDLMADQEWLDIDQILQNTIGDKEDCGVSNNAMMLDDSAVMMDPLDMPSDGSGMSGKESSVLCVG